MNPIGELLRVEDIVLDLDASDALDVLKRVAALLPRPEGMDEADVLAALVAREERGSTAMGHGVALPHARMPQCDAPALALVRTTLAVPFGAPDDRPVSVFLGLVVPERATRRHLRLLAAAAAMFGDRELREKLKTCDSAADVHRLLLSWQPAHDGLPVA